MFLFTKNLLFFSFGKTYRNSRANLTSLRKNNKFNERKFFFFFLYPFWPILLKIQKFLEFPADFQTILYTFTNIYNNFHFSEAFYRFFNDFQALVKFSPFFSNTKNTTKFYDFLQENYEKWFIGFFSIFSCYFLQLIQHFNHFF